MRKLGIVLISLMTLAAGGTGLALAATPGPATTGGTLDVLTYNVAGLPEAVSSAPTPRASSTTAIGQRIGAYDLINVQEDFNYHANLYAGDTHAYRTPTSGGAGIGSGLNTLSSLPYDTDDFERVHWNSCQLDSGDCLTPKGFTFLRLQLAAGVYLDTYNLHTNAGTSSGDESSRADNLRQLTAFIATHSAGHAVLVMGDTNTRYTRAADTIAAFARDNGLTDAWVRLARGGVEPTPGSAALECNPAAITDSCEVVDKVLYRSSQFITLEATAYHNRHAAFLDSSGAMLSDHDPINVTFTWSTNPALATSEQFGGPHGSYFDDTDQVPFGGTQVGRVNSVFIRTGSRVDQVGVNLSTGTTLAHGGSGGSYASLTLSNGEYISSGYLCRGTYRSHTRIFSIKFTTNLGRTLAGGRTTSDCTMLSAPSGWAVLGFYGRSGAEVDKLGFIYSPR